VETFSDAGGLEQRYMEHALERHGRVLDLQLRHEQAFEVGKIYDVHINVAGSEINTTWVQLVPQK
jgi:hypothetical protein